jgi:hypothetical protein
MESIPIVENGAVDCTRGQAGRVWFLAGTFGGEAVRSCTIPPGKSLFFPLVNGIWWLPEDAPDVTGLRRGVGGGFDGPFQFECTVDGTPCAWFTPITRQQSNALPLDLPPGGAAESWGYAPGLRPASVADGYWVMLDPLPRGRHVIHFSARAAEVENGFALDVTYNLLVR